MSEPNVVLTGRPSPDLPAVPVRTAAPRHYLLCPPLYFDVEYAINPWMNLSVPVDRERALAEWEALRTAYESLGHRVSLLDPVPGLPDMVFAANGATVVDGTAYLARFAAAERAGEVQAFRDWFSSRDYVVAEPTRVNEGEGDLVVVGNRVLAGTGFRTEPAAHREVRRALGLPVVTLTLIDPRYYHLDTALFALDTGNIAYFPGAFSASSRRWLERVYPHAVVADEQDAGVLGLNAVSDGRHVVLPAQAAGLVRSLEARGYVPVPVDLSELRKAGGGPKCCTQEVRTAP